MERNSYQVLHCHTNLSDGTLSHKEVLDKCAEYGIGTVAFTDHDILITEAKFQELKALNHPVKFISGVEISLTGTPEIERSIPSFHLIGLFVDHTNDTLNKYCTLAREKRRERLADMVSKLTSQGFSITEKEVEDNAKDGSIGRPHIVRVLLSKEQNIRIIEKTLEKLRVESGRNPSLLSRYDEVRKHNVFQQIFDIFLSDDAFVPGIYTPYRKQVTLDSAVKLIRDARGIAVLAHPGFYRQEVDINLIEKFAKDGRIDGIETIYEAFPDGIMPATFIKDGDAHRRIINDYRLVSAGGGDFHTPEDFERLLIPANKERMEETKGFLDRIFAKWPEYKDKIY